MVAREGEWTFIKGVLGWILDTEAGKLTLPERNLEELLTLVDIPPTITRWVERTWNAKWEKSAPCTLQYQGRWPTSSTFNAH